MDDDHWLENEDMDFKKFTAISPYNISTGTDGLFSEDDENDDDEEVFFGPQTLNEKIAAKVVNEVEAASTVLSVPTDTDIDPAMRALIFRDAAQVQLALKHGTPKKKNSPIAIVRPMGKHGCLVDALNPKSLDPKDSQNGCLLKKGVTENRDKENEDPSMLKPKLSSTSTLNLSQLKASKFSGQSKLAKGLPISKLRPLGQSNLVKESSKQVTEPSENINNFSKKMSNLNLSFQGQRSSSAPTPNSRLTTDGNKGLKQPKGSVPSMLPGLSQRTKPASSLPQHEDRMKPVKAVHAKTNRATPCNPNNNNVSKLPSSAFRQKGEAQDKANVQTQSQGSLLKRQGSLKRQSQLKCPQSATVKASNTAEKLMEQDGKKIGVPTIKKPGSLLPQAGATANSALRRKGSFNKGQPKDSSLNASKSSKGETTATEAAVDTTMKREGSFLKRRSLNLNGPRIIRNDLVTPHRTPSMRPAIAGRQLMAVKPTDQDNNSSETCNETTLVDDSSSYSTPFINDMASETKTNTSVPAPSDIIARYMKLKENSLSSSLTSEPSDINQDVSQTNDSTSESLLNDEVADVFGSNKGHLSPLSEPKNIPKKAEASPLLKLSPPHSPTKDQMVAGFVFVDPFKTGLTPPPLIDFADILQPVTTRQQNLIEFSTELL